MGKLIGYTILQDTIPVPSIRELSCIRAKQNIKHYIMQCVSRTFWQINERLTFLQYMYIRFLSMKKLVFWHFTISIEAKYKILSFLIKNQQPTHEQTVKG